MFFFFSLPKGKFGETEIHSRRKFQDYLTDLENYATGLMIPVSYFTKRKSGLVDTELIKQTVQLMTENRGELQNDDQKRMFYASFLYCAMTLMSVEFDYIPYSDPLVWQPISFPHDLYDGEDGQMNFLNLINYSHLLKGDDTNIGDVFAGWYFVHHLSTLYYLLTGKTIALPRISLIPRESIDPASEQDWKEFEEWLNQNPWDNTDIEMLSSEGGPEPTPITVEEYEESGKLSGEKLKAVYPGYTDYTENLEQFIALFDTYATADFQRLIRDMITDFLLYQGYSLYNKEDAYIEVMVSINAARRKVMEVMRYEK